MFRKMRRFGQQITDEECIEVLKNTKRGVLSLIGDDGYPYGVPLVHWYCEEDDYLWVRMTEQGMKFANLPDNLVNVRVGEEMYQRRGGMKYFKSEARLQKYMYKHGIISLPRYLYNVAGRFAVQVAMPNKVRSFVFQKLFRR